MLSKSLVIIDSLILTKSSVNGRRILFIFTYKTQLSKYHMYPCDFQNPYDKKNRKQNSYTYQISIAL